MGYWEELEHYTDLAPILMAHPLVRAAINTRVSGEASVWPVEALRRVLGSRAPLAETLSIGCGIGSLERSLIDEGMVRKITAVDLSAPALEEARAQAGTRPVEYLLTDARQYLREHRHAFDAIFFHQSLHHFDALDDLMELVRDALRPGGLLYVDEYTGPSRDEWHWWRLVIPNLAYRLLPFGTRRARIIRAPINHEDPTEALRSSEIIRAIERRFVITHRRDYGGNLLSVVYPNMTGGPAATPGVSRLIVFEDWLLRLGALSFYTIIHAEARS